MPYFAFIRHAVYRYMPRMSIKLRGVNVGGHQHCTTECIVIYYSWSSNVFRNHTDDRILTKEFIHSSFSNYFSASMYKAVSQVFCHTRQNKLQLLQ